MNIFSQKWIFAFLEVDKRFSGRNPGSPKGAEK